MAEDPQATERRSRYPFSGIPSFLRAPIAADPSRIDADVAVLGVPTDEGSPFMPDRKSTRLNSSHIQKSRMPSSA